MEIEFNQPLSVPPFMNKDGKKRKLLDQSQIDMTKVIRIKFGLQSGINPNEIRYSIAINDWTEGQLDL